MLATTIGYDSDAVIDSVSVMEGLVVGLVDGRTIPIQYNSAVNNYCSYCGCKIDPMVTGGMKQVGPSTYIMNNEVRELPSKEELARHEICDFIEEHGDCDGQCSICHGDEDDEPSCDGACHKCVNRIREDSEDEDEDHSCDDIDVGNIFNECSKCPDLIHRSRDRFECLNCLTGKFTSDFKLVIPHDKEVKQTPIGPILSEGYIHDLRRDYKDSLKNSGMSKKARKKSLKRFDKMHEV